MKGWLGFGLVWSGHVMEFPDKGFEFGVSFLICWSEGYVGRIPAHPRRRGHGRFKTVVW